MWQYGRLVFGPEADLSLSTVKQSKINVVTTNYWTVPAVNPPSSFSNLATAEASVNWITTARGRVGFALSDWLFFATGGLAVAGFDVQSTANSASSLKYNNTILGYVAGAGFQRALTPELSVRLEYQYLGFPSKTYSSALSSPCQYCSTQTWTSSINPSMQIVRGGIDWKLQ